MTEAPGPSPWQARLAYGGLAILLLAAALLPLARAPLPWAAPDLLLAVTLACAARRPDAIPVLLVAAVFLLADLVLQRPPGLMAALVIVATEGLRRRAAQLRRGSFAGEWLAAGVAMAGVAAGERLALTLLVSPQAQLGLELVQVILTVLTYPAVAGLGHLALGLSRPGEADARGRAP